jgi:hypothetical protein
LQVTDTSFDTFLTLRERPSPAAFSIVWFILNLDIDRSNTFRQSEKQSSPDVAKTLSFFIPGFRAATPPSKKLKDFAPRCSEMQSSRVVPLASAPAGCAVLYSTTRDHCGALKICREGFSKSREES